VWGFEKFSNVKDVAGIFMVVTMLAGVILAAYIAVHHKSK
jgi:hypothetical protein